MLLIYRAYRASHKHKAAGRVQPPNVDVTFRVATSADADARIYFFVFFFAFFAFFAMV